MNITVSESGSVEVIHLQGRLDSVEAPQMDKALQDAFRRGRYNLVIDMSELEYMSSAGFRALASARRNSVRHDHGDVVLAQVPPLVHEALEMIGFTSHFITFGDVSSAVAHFGESAAASGA